MGTRHSLAARLAAERSRTHAGHARLDDRLPAWVHHSGMPAPAEPLRTPEWDALRLFLRVAEEGSLSKAAATLNLSQPTLSRQISALEQSLGIALFERTARGMALTEMAQALVGPVRAMHEQSLAVARITQGLEATVRGVARVSASELVAAHHLPDMLADLRREQPEIDVLLLATDELSNLVEREADIAVRMVRPDQPGLVARKVVDLPVGIYAHRSYLERRGEPTHFQDLLEHDLVASNHGDILRAGLVRAGLDEARLRFSMASNSHVVAWNLVRAGLGIGFITTVIGDREPGVRRILRDAPTPALPVWMTVHQEVRASPRLRRVYDFLVERFGQLA